MVHGTFSVSQIMEISISSLTEGSGLFDFEGTFPGFISDISNLTDEISSQISSLFSKFYLRR